ncbi:MAG: resuscitation-promoting factor RpfB [Patescibacteria group bacterium]|nr:resuscitation-promoting factor RpfB [Patescibacteria group bacterium]
MKKPIIQLASKFTKSIGVIFVLPIFLLAVIIVTMTSTTHAGNNNQSQSGHLITIHDRGIEKVVVSKAETIGDVLKESGISMDVKDVVEPAITEKLVASDYQVNIYRARPVVIVDGNIKTKIVTPYQTATQIVKSAGIKLYDEDKTDLELADNIIADGASLKLTINRAKPFTFNLYGNTTTVRTQADTVGEMLSEKGIKLGKDDRISPSADTKITSELTVKLWREGKQTIVVEEEVGFETETIQDGDKKVGYREIRTVGEKGSRTVTYEVLIENGQEVSRTEIASLTTKESKEQVEVIGIKVTLPAGSHTDWMAAAGISEGDYGYVDYIITRESHWNPGAINSTGCGGNGCYGLGQTNLKSLSGACPSWQSDPVCQLRYFSSYAVNHGYGSWNAAYNFWVNHGWW